MYINGVCSEQTYLKVICWNIQGIGTKLELESVQGFLFRNDIIFLSETMKLDSFVPDIAGFRYFHCQRSYQHPRARRPSGGIGVFIRSDLFTSGIVTLEKFTEWVIWLKIKIDDSILILGGVYIPPIGSKVNTRLANIYDDLQKDIAIFLDRTSLVSVCGDFNSRVGDLCDYEEILHDRNSSIAYLSSIQNNCSASEWNRTKRLVADNVVNTYGKDLINLCKASNLRIMNGLHTPQSSSSYTCYASMGKSTVDYLICSNFFQAM